MQPTTAIANSSIGAIAGYIGTKVMEPVSMKLYEWEPEKARKQAQLAYEGSAGPELAYRFIRHCLSPAMDKLTTTEGAIGCRLSTWANSSARSASTRANRDSTADRSPGVARDQLR